MNFYLNCWVPSLKDYIKVSELTMHQLEVLSKYIVNDDDVGTNEYFEQIIQNNVIDASLKTQLTRLDKWFILTFLKANNISPKVIIKAKTPEDADCTIDYDLFNILTIVSESTLPFEDTLQVKNFTAKFQYPSSLLTHNILLETIHSISLDEKLINFNALPKESKVKFLSTVDSTLLDLLKSYLQLQDSKADVILIKNTNNLKNIFDVKLNIFDNTLFYFLKSIYAPYAKSIYLRKYNLISKVGLSLQDIGNLTPFEADIYLNIYNNEQKALAEDVT